MKILCDVNQAECLRYGVDAPSSTVKIEVDPKSLTEEQRNFVADELYDGLRFPASSGLEICPPTYEGFIAAIQFGLKEATRPKANVVRNLGTQTSSAANQEELDKFDKELEEFRSSLIKAAIKESEKAANEAKQVKSQGKALGSIHGLDAAGSGAIELALKRKSSR